MSQFSRHHSAADKGKQQGNGQAALWNKLAEEKEKKAIDHMMLARVQMIKTGLNFFTF